MQWTTAGHPLPLLHLADGDEVRPIGDGSEGGLPLGMTAGVPYDSARLTLPPGGRVLLYTDGLADSFPMNAQVGHSGLRRRRHLRRRCGQPRPARRTRRSSTCSRRPTPSRSAPAASMTRPSCWWSGRSERRGDGPKKSWDALAFLLAGGRQVPVEENEDATDHDRDGRQPAVRGLLSDRRRADRPRGAPAKKAISHEELKALMAKTHEGDDSPLGEVRKQLAADDPDWTVVGRDVRALVDLGASRN